MLCAALFLHGCSASSQAPPSAWPPVTLTPQDRLLVLAPHPDDEVLGCGGIIQDAMAARLPVRVVFFTYGDNNQWSFLLYRKHPVFMPQAVQAMGSVRHDEAVAADRLLGLSPDQLTFLGYPDFGTLHIWQAHWGDRPPLRSMLTHVTAVPYPTARRPGAAYKGEEVVKDLTDIISEFRPTKVFVSHPADHMPDHAALYLFLRIALWDVEPALQPEVYPYLIHFGRWPPHRFRSADDLLPPPRLIHPVAWRQHRLSAHGLERKHQALQAHRTQYRSNTRYLRSFIRPNELFGEFPLVRLAGGETSTGAASGQTEDGTEPPEELTDEERARFVGVEARRMWLEDGRLVLSVTYSRPLAETLGLSVFAFGYRHDRPFGQMPKLHLRLGAFTHTVLDQDRILDPAGIEVTRQPTQVTVRIPLSTLGDPQRILTSARTYLGELPLDWVSWRVLEITDGR